MISYPPLIVAPTRTYTMTFPDDYMLGSENISTNCGSVAVANGTVTLDTYSYISHQDVTCNFTVLEKIFPAFVIEQSSLWSQTADLSNINNPPVEYSASERIDPILLPLKTTLVQIGNWPPTIIFSTTPSLPTGLTLARGRIQGSISDAGRYFFTVLASDVFSGLSTPIGNYTIVVTEPASSSLGISPGYIGIIVACGALALLVAILLVYLRVQRRRTAARPFDFTKLLAEQPKDLALSREIRAPKEIRRDRVEVTGSLGSGNFGSVHKAQLSLQGTTSTVAVKELHDGPDSSSGRDQLLAEATLMAQFENDNVVSLIGVVTIGNPLWVVIEFCEKGALDEFLQNFDTNLAQQLKFSSDCAKGMMYLASLRFIHRDLAARNVLLTSDYTAKIADFGMSRESRNKAYYTSRSGGPLPVRWTAPEALEMQKYSEQSDVWSFGVLMYEIWTQAMLPYHGMSNDRVWTKVMAGFRLPRPLECPEEVHAVMLACWSGAGSRPPFFKLVTRFDDLIKLALKGEIKDPTQVAAPIARRSAINSPFTVPADSASAINYQYQLTSSVTEDEDSNAGTSAMANNDSYLPALGSILPVTKAAARRLSQHLPNSGIVYEKRDSNPGSTHQPTKSTSTSTLYSLPAAQGNDLDIVQSVELSLLSTRGSLAAPSSNAEIEYGFSEGFAGTIAKGSTTIPQPEPVDEPDDPNAWYADQLPATKKAGLVYSTPDVDAKPVVKGKSSLAYAIPDATVKPTKGKSSLAYAVPDAMLNDAHAQNGGSNKDDDDDRNAWYADRPLDSKSGLVYTDPDVEAKPVAKGKSSLVYSAPDATTLPSGKKSSLTYSEPDQPVIVQKPRRKSSTYGQSHILHTLTSQLIISQMQTRQRSRTRLSTCRRLPLGPSDHPIFSMPCQRLRTQGRSRQSAEQMPRQRFRSTRSAAPMRL